MPNLRSSLIGETGIRLVTSDGRNLSVSYADLLDRFARETGGSRTARKTRVIDAVKAEITAQCVELLGDSTITLDFDDLTGRVLTLEVRDGR